MDVKWLEELSLAGKVGYASPMAELTTMRVGGPADAVVFAAEVGDIEKVVVACREKDVPLTVVGRGSNLVVRDGGLRGVVLLLGKAFDRMNVNGTRLTAQAGATLTALSRLAAANGLTGLEFAEGIPGSVGGGIYMNAGAYGGEMKNVLARAVVLLPDGKIVQQCAEGLEMGYRHSILMENGGIVLEAEFALQIGEPETIQQTMEQFSCSRREKQPLQYPSSGSFFKRPEGHFAGKLIEDAGLKGARVGGAEISKLHAGFLINVDHASAADVLGLMERVQDEVQARFGVRLEPEVRILGEPDRNMR